MDLTSRVKNNNGGTRTLIKVDEIINNSSHEKRRGKNSNRKVVWFNPPFCRLVNINIGKYFLYLLDKHFNRDNPLSRIFTRNTVKISYSCTKNMYNILSNHNKRLLNELITRDMNPDVGSCNCRNKEECPLGGRCNSRNSYTRHAFLLWDGERGYIGISAGNWRQRWYNHKHSFSNPKLRYQTALSKYFGTLRIRGYLHKLSGK